MPHLERPSLQWNSPHEFTYGFLPGAKEGQIAKVVKYVQEWALYANVTFTKVEDYQSALVRIAFDGRCGSWSYVGRDVESCNDPTKPTMNLGWINSEPGSDEEESLERAVILHEWGHTLGLLHEHESPAHDNFSVNEDAAYKIFGGSPNFWSREMIKEQVRTASLFLYGSSGATDAPLSPFTALSSGSPAGTDLLLARHGQQLLAS